MQLCNCRIQALILQDPEQFGRGTVCPAFPLKSVIVENAQYLVGLGSQCQLGNVSDIKLLLHFILAQKPCYKNCSCSKIVSNVALILSKENILCVAYNSCTSVVPY